MNPTTLQIRGGRWFDYANPTVDQIDLDDIATSLSFTVRWAGHVPWFYSVAEHAMLVYRLVRGAGAAREVCYAALHHDDHETYLGDLPTPLKRLLEADAPGVWRDLVQKADNAISEHLGIDPALLHHPVVVAADAKALAWEGRMFGRTWITDHSPIPNWAIRGLNPIDAKAEFLGLHREARHA